MEQLVQYIFLFLIGTTILNFLIALGVRAKTGNPEFNILILYWTSLFATYGCVAALSKTQDEIAFAYFAQFMPSFLMTKMLRDSRGIRTNWKVFLSLQAVSSLISAHLILNTEAGFTLSLLPVVITTALPFVEPAWNALVSHRHEASWIEKGMAFMFVTGVINHFNYAIFRLDESAAWWGWSVSIAQYQCLSVFLPLLINHKHENRQRKKLEETLEKLSANVTRSSQIDDLYLTLELQISEKEKFAAQLAESNRLLNEERKANEVLVRTISHDLLNPLTVVSGYLEMIQSGRVAPQDSGKIRDRMQMNLKSALSIMERPQEPLQ